MLATFLFIAFLAVLGNRLVFTLLYCTFSAPNHMYKTPHYIWSFI